MFNTGNPLDDAISHGDWIRKCDELLEYQKCSVDGKHYSENEVVYDKDGCNYVAIKNVEEYLADFKHDMLIEDYKKLETELYNQIKQK